MSYGYVFTQLCKIHFNYVIVLFMNCFTSTKEESKVVGVSSKSQTSKFNYNMRETSINCNTQAHARVCNDKNII